MKRFASIVLVVALGLGLCSCAISAAQSSNGHAGSGSSSTTLVLQVTRTPRESSTPVTFSKTLTDGSAAQRLYSAAIAPPIAGYQLCPTQTRDYVYYVYHLTFLSRTINVAQMTLEDYGCMKLTIETDDHRATDHTFIQLFAQTMDIESDFICKLGSGC